MKVEFVDADAHKQHRRQSRSRRDVREEAPPRLRSYVQGDTSKLESRDVSDPESDTVCDRPLLEQVAGAANNSHEVTPDIQSAIEVAANIKRKGFVPGSASALTGRCTHLRLHGRARPRPEQVGQPRLGEERAKAVPTASTTPCGRAPRGGP